MRVLVVLRIVWVSWVCTHKRALICSRSRSPVDAALDDALARGCSGEVRDSATDARDGGIPEWKTRVGEHDLIRIRTRDAWDDIPCVVNLTRVELDLDNLTALENKTERVHKRETFHQSHTHYVSKERGTESGARYVQRSRCANRRRGLLSGQSCAGPAPQARLRQHGA